MFRGFLFLLLPLFFLFQGFPFSLFPLSPFQRCLFLPFHLFPLFLPFPHFFPFPEFPFSLISPFSRGFLFPPFHLFPVSPFPMGFPFPLFSSLSTFSLFPPFSRGFPFTLFHLFPLPVPAPTVPSDVPAGTAQPRGHKAQNQREIPFFGVFWALLAFLKGKGISPAPGGAAGCELRSAPRGDQLIFNCAFKPGTGISSA